MGTNDSERNDGIDSGSQPDPEAIRAFERFAAAVRKHRPIGPFETSDFGNAERLKALYGDRLRYCEEWGKVLAWDEHRWSAKSEVFIRQCMMDTVRRIRLELNAESDAATRKKFAQWAINSEKRERIEAAIGLSRSLLDQVEVSDLDTDPWLLNCLNGTVDLRTGKLREHDPNDNITKLCKVEYDPCARAPRWGRFLLQIMNGNKHFVKALQRIVGYCLTGDVSEHALFLLWGKGANGKSTLTGVTLKMLGPEYAVEGAGDLLLAKNSESHPTELAHLHGKRCVTTSEANKNRRLNEGLVKRLTGGDQITARRMREDFWSFDPTHKILFAANYKPVIKGTDTGIWRRIVLIPFEVLFDGGKEDKKLPDKLCASELPGILAWAVRGCLEWQRDGLKIPDEWRAAKQEYRADSDDLAPFIEEKCILDPDVSVSIKDLYEAYTSWCEAEGRQALDKANLGRELQDRGFPSKKMNNKRYRKGLRLRTPLDYEDQ